jgi:hypothetical protein
VCVLASQRAFLVSCLLEMQRQRCERAATALSHVHVAYAAVQGSQHVVPGLYTAVQAVHIRFSTGLPGSPSDVLPLASVCRCLYLQVTSAANSSTVAMSRLFCAAALVLLALATASGEAAPMQAVRAMQQHRCRPFTHACCALPVQPPFRAPAA